MSSTPRANPPEPTSGYLDAASGEPLHPAAREVMIRAFDQAYADPRRLYGPARNARLVLDNARAVVAECLGVRPDEVTFTGSGTHAVQLGLLGLLTGRSAAAMSGRLLASAVEHSSVLHAGSWFAERGGEVSNVPVDELGRVRVETLRGLLGESGSTSASRSTRRSGNTPTIVAIQTANHEVGTRQPLGEVAGALATSDAAGTALFVDACADGGREPLPGYGDVLALSAHKWGGPAGVGVLVVRKRHSSRPDTVRWRMPFPTDDRVDERGSGFENIPAALGAAAALQAMVAERAALAERQHRLTRQIRERLAEIPDVAVLGDPEHRLPHLVAASCLYVDGEALVTELDRRGWSIASGSACTASTLAPSHVLEAMGVLTHGNLRISLTRHTSEEEVAALLRDLPEVIASIRAQIEW